MQQSVFKVSLASTGNTLCERETMLINTRTCYHHPFYLLHIYRSKGKWSFTYDSDNFCLKIRVRGGGETGAVNGLFACWPYQINRKIAPVAEADQSRAVCEKSPKTHPSSETDNRDTIFETFCCITLTPRPGTDLWDSLHGVYDTHPNVLLRLLQDSLHSVVWHSSTRWYPRGIQKLVSTYDLPDSGPTGKCQDGGGFSGVRTENTQSAKNYLNFNLRGGGGCVVWTENTQIAKIYLNLNFRGGGYSGVRTENTECQDLPKFKFSGGGTLESELKILKSAKICLNFNFLRGGLSGLKFQRGALWRIWTQILLFEVTVHKPACASQIVSHILRMWRLIRFEKRQTYLATCNQLATENSGAVIAVV